MLLNAVEIQDSSGQWALDSQNKVHFLQDGPRWHNQTIHQKADISEGVLYSNRNCSKKIITVHDWACDLCCYWPVSWHASFGTPSVKSRWHSPYVVVCLYGSFTIQDPKSKLQNPKSKLQDPNPQNQKHQKLLQHLPTMPYRTGSDWSSSAWYSRWRSTIQAKMRQNVAYTV